MTARVPMNVLGGFLGAGKTTLLNRILAGSHGVRCAVLVNDFGELAVDGGLVAAHDGETVTFANGCVCCSMGDDLVGTLDRLLGGARPPEHILVEASGVADPGAIADVATLHPGLARDLVVVLADVETVRARYGDSRLQDTVTRQLAAADLLVLNKCDRVPEAEIRGAEAWARERSPAPAIRSVDADVPMELLTGARTDAARPAPPGAASPEPSGAAPVAVKSASHVRADAPGPEAHQHGADHASRFVSRFVPCPAPVDPGRLRAALSDLMPRVLRAKGFVVSAEGSGREWLVVQACGRTVNVERGHPVPEHSTPAPGLVFIGLDDLPAADELACAVHRAASSSRQCAVPQRTSQELLQFPYPDPFP